MSSMMPAAGRTLWEVNILFDDGRKFVPKKLRITSEQKDYASGHLATLDYLELHKSRFQRAEIRSIIFKGIIHA